jgi:hypothetical protein
MTQGQSIYESLGVDPHKTGVKEIFGKIVSNEFPGAFANIVRIPNRPVGLTKHSDGSGQQVDPALP